MKVKAAKHLSDFEWGAACQYIVYVQFQAKLQDVSSAQIYNFPYARLGPDKLIASKGATVRRLEANLRRLEIWVGERGEGLEDEDKVVLRTMYRSIGGALETVRDHLKLAKKLSEQKQSLVFGKEDSSDDELPF